MNNFKRLNIALENFEEYEARNADSVGIRVVKWRYFFDFGPSPFIFL